MERALRDELIINLNDLIGEVYLLDLVLDDPPQAKYCSPEVFQSLRATLVAYIQQHTADIAWMSKALISPAK